MSSKNNCQNDRPREAGCAVRGTLTSSYDRVAQSAEHLTFNQGVGRSNRPTITNPQYSCEYKYWKLEPYSDGKECGKGVS